MDSATHTSQNEILEATQKSEQVEPTVHESSSLAASFQDSVVPEASVQTHNPSLVDEKQGQFSFWNISNPKIVCH